MEMIECSGRDRVKIQREVVEFPIFSIPNLLSEFCV